MLRFVFVLLFETLIFSGLFAQDCLPESPVQVDAGQISTEQLRRLFDQYRPSFSEDQVDAQIANMSRCVLGMERELRSLENQLSFYSLKYQEVLSYKDVTGLRKQVRQLETSRKESRKELDQNLSNVKHTGIFITVLTGIDLYADKSAHLQNARSALTSRAVEDLNGTNIQRLTEVSDYAAVRDLIQSYIGGEVSNDRDFYDNTNFAKKHFVYAAKVSVAPLKEPLPESTAAASSDVLVLNPLIDLDYKNQLLAAGIRQEDVEAIDLAIQPYLMSVKTENREADQRQRKILERGMEELRKIDFEIAEANRRIADRSRKIREICEELQVPFEEAKIDESASNALEFLKKEVRETDLQWKEIKEREIVSKETFPSIEGSPAESFAAEVVKLVEQIRKSYETVSKMEERITVEHYQVTDYSSARKVQLYRTVDRVWVFPVPREDGTFRLVVFSKFRFTGKEAVDDPAGNTEVTPSFEDVPVKKEISTLETTTFTMGNNRGESDEQPEHRVLINSFLIDSKEVSFDDFENFCQSTGRRIPDDNGWGRGDRPVINVSWYDAIAYCNWRSKREGLQNCYTINGKNIRTDWTANGYRLPTEAEWEFASKSGQDMEYAGSASLKEVGWYNGNAGSQTKSTGLKTPNANGLFDLSGNVQEWCWDWYSGRFYEKNQGNNPLGPTQGVLKVVRGGSWISSDRSCRVTARNALSPDEKNAYTGFRCVRRK